MTGPPACLGRHLLDAIWVTGAAELAYGLRRDVLIREREPHMSTTNKGGDRA